MDAVTPYIPAERRPWLCREVDARQGRGEVEHEERQEEDRGSRRGLRCRACGHIITSREQSMEVGGAHRHTFFNPAGIVYELGCFKTAPGCAVVGESSAEFAWFAGHVWRVALCGGCGEHLGWQFSSGDTVFYGLILPRLLDENP